MTDKKISQLTAMSTVVDTDVFPAVETSTLETKKIAWSTIKSVLKTYLDTLYSAAETTTTIGALILGATAKTTTPADADMFALMDSAASNIVKKYSWAKLKTHITTLTKAFSNSSVSAVSGAYAADTYLAGSTITIPTAGGWQAGCQYRVRFDMVKTAAGTGTFEIKVRMGTAGSTSDAVILTLTFGAGSAAIDTGLFDVLITFRTVGSGTSAVVQGIAKCQHHLAATGLTNTGASGCGIIIGTSSGFDSTSQTKIGISINGGTSFSGTCTLVQAQLLGLSV